MEPPIVPIEIAQIELIGTPLKFEHGDYDVERYNPGKHIEWGALAAHHILDSDLVDRPKWDPELEYGFEPDSFLIGHNIDFDWGVLGSPQHVRRICTLALCRHYLPDVDSHRLGAMVYFVLGANSKTRDLVRQAHGAGPDAVMVMNILPFLIEKSGAKTWDELWAKSEVARIPLKMPYGRNKGVLISELDIHDPGYARWMLKQKDVDPYLRTALERRVLR